MNRDSSFGKRIRQARLPRILLVYAAASWLVFQVAALLRQELGLPGWVTPAVLLLLLAGLPIVVATAWVQSHPLAAVKAKREEVPASWEFDLSDARESVAHGRLPHPTWARAAAGATLAFLLLALAVTGAVLLRNRGGALAPSEAVAGAAAPGIAVLPFSVSGAGLDPWREGVVDLVSTNLDGVAGLRAIDSRTVLASWREGLEEDASPDLERSLEIARRAGARYALTGSAVASGRGMRIVADIYDVETGAELGEAQVEGSPDSVFGLVDRLSIEVLRAIPRGEREPLPSVDLARVTTRSVPALKAFLEGEALFRRSDFRGAIPAYERAVRADSTFALALYRLSFSHSWIDNITSELAHEYAGRAVSYAGRLPEREALLVRGLLALQLGTLDGLELLRTAVEKYPDDAEAWFILGDTYHHLGENALVPPEESGRAFRRALALDPSFSPAYIHLIEMAIWLQTDSALAARLAETYARLAPGSEFGVRNRLALDLAFGVADARARAWKELESSPVEVLMGVTPYLLHPRFSDLREEVQERALRRPDNPRVEVAAERLFWTYVTGGKVRAALRLLEDPDFPEEVVTNALYVALRDSVLEIAPDRVEGALERALRDSVPDQGAFFAAAIAADRGRWDEHETIVERFRSYAPSVPAEDSLLAARLTSAIQALELYGLWRRGQPERALRGFQQQQGKGTPFDEQLRWWIAELLLELGRPADAEPYLRSMGFTPWAQIELARVYEQLGKHEKARRAWELVALGWRGADPELQPRVEEARAAVRRLTSVIRE